MPVNVPKNGIEQELKIQQILQRRIVLRYAPSLTGAFHNTARGLKPSDVYEPDLRLGLLTFEKDALFSTLREMSYFSGITTANRILDSGIVPDKILRAVREVVRANILQEATVRASDLAQIVSTNTGRLITQFAKEAEHNNLSLSKVPDFVRMKLLRHSSGRAETIVKTQSHEDIQAAVPEVLETAGIPMDEKEWVTSEDERVRKSHARLHGLVIPGDENFDSDGSQLQYPGDASQGAEPSQIINCRCILVWHTAERAV